MLLAPFNPYQQWLGLETRGPVTTHYQLLGLPDGEPDPGKIALALSLQHARLAMADVGPRVAVVHKLAGELRLAQQCLTHPVLKAQYDRRLRGERSTVERWRVPARKAQALCRAAHDA
jgi:hypothetical protein